MRMDSVNFFVTAGEELLNWKLFKGLTELEHTLLISLTY